MKALQTGALTLTLSAAALGAADGAPKPPFIEDDYAHALAQARQRKLPLFVEVWAPW